MFSAKVVVFGQKWLYSVKRDCIRAKVVIFGKVVLFRKEWLYLGKIGCIRAKWLYPGKVVVVG